MTQEFANISNFLRIFVQDILCLTVVSKHLQTFLESLLFENIITKAFAHNYKHLLIT